MALKSSTYLRNKYVELFSAEMQSIFLAPFHESKSYTVIRKKNSDKFYCDILNKNKDMIWNKYAFYNVNNV